MLGLTMTPIFTIRVWGNPSADSVRISEALNLPHKRMPVCEIEVDRINNDRIDLTITGHRGLELIPQKMLPPVPEQPTLWHQEER